MVYQIRKYELLDKTIHVYTKREDLEFKTFPGNYVQLIETSTQNKYDKSKFYTYSKTLPEDAIEDIGQKFLPYFADVTQDIPSHYTFEPKTWLNCQLLKETHGSYLQFFDKSTQEKLRIAMNSNYYTPKK